VGEVAGHTISCTRSSWKLMNLEPRVCRTSLAPALFFRHSSSWHSDSGMNSSDLIWGRAAFQVLKGTSIKYRRGLLLLHTSWIVSFWHCVQV
jgi:hypothetical protein